MVLNTISIKPNNICGQQYRKYTGRISSRFSALKYYIFPYLNLAFKLCAKDVNNNLHFHYQKSLIEQFWQAIGIEKAIEINALTRPFFTY